MEEIVLNKKDDRQRVWGAVFYPESVRSDWREVLENLKVPLFVSPLHDLDLDPATGELKKPHYHLLLIYSGNKSMQQVLDDVRPLGIKFVEKQRDVRASVRYLCHLDFRDRPDKRQYDPSDVLCMGGLNYLDECNSPGDKRIMLEEMISFCVDNDVLHFCDFVDYCRLNNSSWFFALTSSCTFFMKEFIKSKHFKRFGK